MSIRPVNENTDEEATLFFELKLAFETPLKLGANTTIPSSLRRPFFYRAVRQRLQGHLLGRLLTFERHRGSSAIFVQEGQDTWLIPTPARGSSNNHLQIKSQDLIATA